MYPVRLCFYTSCRTLSLYLMQALGGATLAIPESVRLFLLNVFRMLDIAGKTVKIGNSPFKAALPQVAICLPASRKSPKQVRFRLFCDPFRNPLLPLWIEPPFKRCPTFLITIRVYFRRYDFMPEFAARSQRWIIAVFHFSACFAKSVCGMEKSNNKCF